MDIKLERGDLIENENMKIVFIKEQRDDNPTTEPSAHANKNCDLVQTNNTKKGLSLDGKNMKKKNRRAKIFLCIVCGYMCKKKLEFPCHFSSNHFFNQKNLFKNEINKNKIRSQDTYRGISIDADVKDEIEIGDHELKEKLDEIGEHENLLKNIDDFKLCFNEMVVSDHMRYYSKTENNPVKYKICSKDSQQRQSVDRLCQIDGNSLESECCSNKHLRTHTGEKHDICSSSFTQKSHLNRNLRTRTGQKPLQCDVCTKSFSQMGSLKNHMPLHSDQKFKCNVCTKSFSLKSNLNSHLRTHFGQKPFKCNVCTKSFSRKDHLEDHLRTHTGQKPSKCSVCTKYFSRKANLNSHLRTHTGQKPFKCVVCTKSFSQEGHLEDHLRIHTGQKPFKCDVCLKSISQKANLKNHLRTHTGQKSFQCNVCTKSFSCKANLNSHLRIHTGQKPFKCNVCTKYFSEKGSLKNHLRIHVGEKTN